MSQSIGMRAERITGDTIDAARGRASTFFRWSAPSRFYVPFRPKTSRRSAQRRTASDHADLRPSPDAWRSSPRAIRSSPRGAALSVIRTRRPAPADARRDDPSTMIVTVEFLAN